MVSKSDALQSHLNVLAHPQRWLAASVNLLTIVLVVIGKTSKNQAFPPIIPIVVSIYCILVYIGKKFDIEVNDTYLTEE